MSQSLYIGQERSFVSLSFPGWLEGGEHHPFGPGPLRSIFGSRCEGGAPASSSSIVPEPPSALPGLGLLG